MIEGVRFGRVEHHADERGSFRELWRESWFPDERFAQANASISAPGVLRGLHLHRHQMDHWVVTRGRGFVALVDIRPVLGGGGKPIVETYEMAVDDWCVIPAGVAHGFLALEELEMLYLVTAEYDGSDELGFAWDDADAAVPWPPVPATDDGRPILSERDRTNPSLRELVASLAGLST